MTDIQRPPTGPCHAGELELLKQRNRKQKRPIAPDQQLSAQSVVGLVLSDGKEITGKYVGRRSLIERRMVSLATNRELMLIGGPGAVEPLLGKLLVAAISGDTTLTIQGSAATTEDAIGYSWDYVMLLTEGPTLESLVPAPIHRGMSEGKVMCFGEITRCAPEVQDSMLSVPPDCTLSILELNAAHRILYAKRGFNVVGTTDIRDRDVSEMPVALERRFNFETIDTIENLEVETALVERETDAMLRTAETPAHLGRGATEVLIKMFRELRSGKAPGQDVECLSSAMSAAEAVSIGMVAVAHATWFGGDALGSKELAGAIVASALKNEPEDVSKLCVYREQHIKKRPSVWQELYKHLP